MFDNLFKEGKIGNMVVPNRVVMTAMGHHMSEPGGVCGDKEKNFYAARAKGGVGLIISECLGIEPHGRGNVCQAAVWDDSFIPGLKACTDAVHANGGKIAAQIYHPGRQGIAPLNGVDTMPAPSPIECQAVHQPIHEMSREEIAQMIQWFADAARRVKEAGFDAVEIHGAHGYLINQFLSPYTNTRTDEYGGSPEGRFRFLGDIIKAVREQVGPDYPIIVRLSVDEHMDYNGMPEEGLHLGDGIAIARMCEEAGVQAIDVSAGIYETMNTAWEPIGFEEGWKVNAPEAVKKEVSIPVIGCTVIRNPEYADRIIGEGKLDFAGSARTHFADPEWANKAKEGRLDEIRRCIQCLHCMETLMEADITGVTVACAINYQGGREAEFGDAAMKKDGNGRNVAIIGGGPAGMEAAIVAAKRGFKPVVFEKLGNTGGQVANLASKPPKKGKIAWLTDYQKAMADKLGVDVRLNTTPTLDDIKALDPYAVIIAQGSHPIMPGSIPGLDQDNVYEPGKILSGEVNINGKNVAVIGSGMTGIETAELLAEQGNTVTVYEMLDEIGPGIFFQNMIDVMSRLGQHDPVMLPKHKLVKIEGNTGTFENLETNETVTGDFDAFVVSLGVAPNTELVDDIKGAFDKVCVVGDAVQGGRIEPAISTGYVSAFEM